MKTKFIILWCVVAVMALGLAGGAYWWLMRPQVIILSDGSKLSLLDVTYGKHHKLAKNKLGGRTLRNGTMNTTNDTLCVWIEQQHEQNNWPNYQVLAYDSAGTACAGESSRTYGNFGGNQQGDEVMGFVFSAFPRRSGRIYVRILEWNNQNGGQEEAGDRFSIRNPAPSASYAKWTPEKLPNTQQDGDLQVTLTRMEIEENTFNRSGGQGDSSDPSSRGVLAAFSIEQGGILVTNWRPIQVDTSDATGNVARNRGTSNREEKDEQVLVYQYGLWPNEPAWKLRVEMSRTSGFLADEMWTVSDIPLTNVANMNEIWNPNRKAKAFAETKMGESQLQIFPVTKLTEEQSRSYGQMDGIIRVHAKPLPPGMRMTIMKITDEKNNPVEFNNWGGGGTEFRYSLKNLGETKTINVTLALHRSRFVEFTVPVPKAK